MENINEQINIPQNEKEFDEKFEKPEIDQLIEKRNKLLLKLLLSRKKTPKL